MFGFDDTTACESDEAICEQVLDWTGNEPLANASDVLIGKPITIVGLLLLFVVTRWILCRLVDRLVASAEDGRPLADKASLFGIRGKAAQQATARDLAISTRRVQRARTMGALLKSIITGVLAAIIATMILSELGVNIAPIIASAGIIGVALGFGAQSLVKDFLSGVFMIIEDQYGVGDVVDVGEASGTVEAVTMRVTRLRDLNGTVWYVPNGAITRVGNMSQNWARAVVDVNVGYGEDLVRAQQVLRDVAHDLWEDEDFKDLIIEEPEVTGVEMFTPEAVTLRVLIKTAPMEQWAVARALRQRIKARFDHEGIEIPLPQRVVWHREEKTGPSPEEEEPVQS